MSTVLEIERAIETLPPEEMKDLLAWLDERQGLRSAAAITFGLYDQEEGDEPQWEG